MGAPTVVIINNAAAAHLEGLGSVQAVAAAKGEIIEGMSPGVQPSFWDQLEALSMPVAVTVRGAPW